MWKRSRRVVPFATALLLAVIVLVGCQPNRASSALPAPHRAAA